MAAARQQGQASRELTASEPAEAQQGWGRRGPSATKAERCWASRELAADKLVEAQQGRDMRKACLKQVGWTQTTLERSSRELTASTLAEAQRLKQASSHGEQGWLKPSQAGPAESSLRAS